MGNPFSAWRAWQDRRLILRQMRRAAGDAREFDHFKVQDQLTYAIAALDNNDLRRATEIWEKMSTEYPSLTQKSPVAFKLLLRLRRFDEAAAIMHAGQKRSPGSPEFLQGLGQIALTKHDYQEALLLFGQMRKRFPGIMDGYTGAAECLRLTDRLAEAEAMAQQAMKQFPDKIAPFLEYARIAAQREDWEEAIVRWEPIRSRFNYFGGYVAGAEALTRLGRYDEAEELLQAARYRFGTNPGPLMEYARVAEARGDIPESIRRWKRVVEFFPLDMPVYPAASSAFEKLGDPVEAEATLRAAVDRFPGELRPPLELALLLHYKHQNYPAAAEAWAELRKAFPDREDAYKTGAQALRHAGRTEEATVLEEEYRRRFKAS